MMIPLGKVRFGAEEHPAGLSWHRNSSLVSFFLRSMSTVGHTGLDEFMKGLTINQATRLMILTDLPMLPDCLHSQNNILVSFQYIKSLRVHV
jgi:hypothetical protein